MSIGHNFNLAIQSADDAHRYHMVTDNSDTNGTQTYQDNPNSTAAFGHRKVLRCKSTVANNTAELAVRLRAVETAGNPATPDFENWQGVFSTPTGPSRVAHTGSYYFQCRFRYQKGSTGTIANDGNKVIKFLNTYAGAGSAVDATQSIQFLIRKSGGVSHIRSKLQTAGTNYDATSVACDEDTDYDLRFQYKPASSSPGSDGIFVVDLKEATASSWTNLVDADDHDQEDDLHWIGYICEPNHADIVSGDGAKVWHTASYGRLDGFEADDYEYDRFRTSTAMDATSSTVNIRVHCTDDMVDTSTGGFRVQYSASSDMSGASNTTYTNFSSRTHDCANIRITGLSADTRYYYRVEFVDNTTTPTSTHVTDAIRSFKTLASATGGTRRVHFFGCNHAEGFAGNNNAIAEMLAVETVPDFMVWMGDSFYDTAVNKLAASNDDYDLWDLNAAEYNNQYRLAYEEYDNNKLLSQCAHFAIWDDHEIINNADGAMRGQAVNMGLAVDVSSDAYGTGHVDTDFLNGGASPVTADALFTLAHSVAAAWWGDSCEGEADGANADYYRAIEHGDILIPIMDTRTRSTITDLITSTQETWLQTTVSASTARFVLLSSQSVWGDWVANTGAVENWGSNSNTRSQRSGIFDWLKENASEKIVYGIGGDRHAPYMATLSGTAVDGCLKYEVCPSPAKSYRWYDTTAIDNMDGATGVLASLDTSDYGANTMVRTSGALLTINEGSGQVDVVLYDDFGTKLIDESHSYPRGGGVAMQAAFRRALIERRKRGV